MPIDEVNERSTWFTTVSFTDENGDPVVPATATYRIDDVGSGQQVRDTTDIDPLETESQIMWEPSDTEILDEANAYETRRMTVSWTYTTAASPSVDGVGNAEYLLNIINLRGVTAPSPA
jgi:hypothetical protein